MERKMKIFNDKQGRFGKPLREIEHKDKFISEREKTRAYYRQRMMLCRSVKVLITNLQLCRCLRRFYDIWAL